VHLAHPTYSPRCLNHVEFFRALESPKILTIDGVDAAAESAFTARTFVNVVDCRYEANRPVVLTSVDTLPEFTRKLKRKVGDSPARQVARRIYEMARGVSVALDCR
jgi:DNA replication protein DnaC